LAEQPHGFNNPGTDILVGTNVMSIVVEVPNQRWVHHTVGIGKLRKKTIINF
jgi:hypothetical protein